MGILKRLFAVPKPVIEYTVLDLGHGYELEVAGENHHRNEVAAILVSHGKDMTVDQKTHEIFGVTGYIATEPDNQYDKNATRVYLEDQHVGYLSREDAARYVTPLTKLERVGYVLHIEARVWARNDHGMIRSRITIYLPEPSEIKPPKLQQ